MFDIPVPKDDGLFIPEVGEWSEDKHYFLARYIDAFTTAMKNKKWSSLHYIDLFAGAGIERLKESGKLDWGSPMIAALAPNSFTKLHLCEKDQIKYETLKERILKVKSNSQILCGDANEMISNIISEIPTDSLSLAFIDPYGLHLDFSTLQALEKNRVDLIIFFPDYLDAVRNWAAYYLNNPESNLDRFLGPENNWRDKIQNIPSQRQAQFIRDLYAEQIRTKLGYSQFDYERISMKGHPLYSLIFCSRHPIAAKLWRGISNKKPDGQRTFDFS